MSRQRTSVLAGAAAARSRAAHWPPAVNHRAKEFEHESKHAFEDAGEGHHFNPESLVEAVRTTFENLLTGLQSILDAPEMPAADALWMDAPLGSPSPRTFSPWTPASPRALLCGPRGFTDGRGAG